MTRPGRTRTRRPRPRRAARHSRGPPRRLRPRPGARALLLRRRPDAAPGAPGLLRPPAPARRAEPRDRDRVRRPPSTGRSCARSSSATTTTSSSPPARRRPRPNPGPGHTRRRASGSPGRTCAVRRPPRRSGHAEPGRDAAAAARHVVAILLTDAAPAPRSTSTSASLTTVATDAAGASTGCALRLPAGTRLPPGRRAGPRRPRPRGAGRSADRPRRAPTSRRSPSCSCPRPGGARGPGRRRRPAPGRGRRRRRPAPLVVPSGGPPAGPAGRRPGGPAGAPAGARAAPPARAPGVVVALRPPAVPAGAGDPGRRRRAVRALVPARGAGGGGPRRRCRPARAGDAAARAGRRARVADLRGLGRARPPGGARRTPGAPASPGRRRLPGAGPAREAAAPVVAVALGPFGRQTDWALLRGVAERSATGWCCCSWASATTVRSAATRTTRPAWSTRPRLARTARRGRDGPAWCWRPTSRWRHCGATRSPSGGPGRRPGGRATGPCGRVTPDLAGVRTWDPAVVPADGPAAVAAALGGLRGSPRAAGRRVAGVGAGADGARARRAAVGAAWPTPASTSA